MFPLFLANALTALCLIAVVSALVGTYFVTRRSIFIAGGITHASFGGLGLGFFLGMDPVVCASLFAVAGSLSVDWLSARRNLRQDSAIAVIWAVGMALGILFVFLSSGFVPELNAFLFGNVLSISRSDILLFGVFLILLASFYFLFLRRIIAVSFDADFALTRRLPVVFLRISMSILTAVAIVLIIKLIGVMLLVSMISLPQLIAEKFTSRYRTLLFISIAVSALTAVGGLFIAYAISVPASATIVLLQALLYVLPLRRYGKRRLLI